ncbi:BZ3500_MvSof-1268-A1-R1_Chr11-1g03170 [Microbotryum saponariae]|uniref:BZ3500_MvSof-1268-A1-R1_Chr11-1g03170 protein n=1 Tax=Microbotryum saponariae TaxID=289078 RepID=A0A2X0LU97_9BASI|nr:BZ3501_MvSof-1269-A2-R1_Chr11g02745 [Microbotryum saponariae]SDA03730.1 BZ3500_MvSof-1268-A1-R1_Chr11-1g03170 [Microbotryum saponariae]
MAVCTHCKARHWKCERTKSTEHFSTCCSQGKVQLPPLPSPMPKAEASRENARSYNNALSFTSLAAHFDQTRLCTLGPPVLRVHGSSTRPRPPTLDLGPGGADSRIQRSTLTKLEPMLRGGNRFVREFASAKARAGWDTAKERVLRLCLPRGRDRRTHNLPTSSTEMAMHICDSDTNTGDRGPQDLILEVHDVRCPDSRPKYQVMASTPTFLFAGSTKLGRRSPATESRSTVVFNCASYLPVLVRMKKAKRRTKTTTMRMKTARKGTKRMVKVKVSVFGSLPSRRSRKRGRGESTRVSRSQFFAYYLHERDDYFSIPHCTQARITDAAIATGLTPNQFGRSVILGSTFKNSPREITQRYLDAMACVAALGPNDEACNRLDLLARVFEAKLNRLCDDVFGIQQRAGCFGVVLTHAHVIEYQKRGLPHAHILILITLAPDEHPLSREAIDKMISAEIPDPLCYPELHETRNYLLFVSQLSDYLLFAEGQRTAEGLINFVYPGRRTVKKESLDDLNQLYSRAGLCNGTRLIVFTQDRDRQLGCTMRRLQFPLRVALAMTINQAQGQSLDRVGVDLSLHLVFTHGQLYVAMSRVMSVGDPAHDDNDLQAVTPNPVFRFVLRAMSSHSSR